MNEYYITVVKSRSYESYGRIFADSHAEINEYIASLLPTEFLVIMDGYDEGSNQVEYIRKDTIESIKVNIFSEGIDLLDTHPMMHAGLIHRKKAIQLADEMLRAARQEAKKYETSNEA